MDGERAPRVDDIVFRGLPAGKYQITARPVGERGERAATSQWFQAAPAPGQQRRLLPRNPGPRS